MKKSFLFIAILTVISTTTNAQDYDFKFSKVQRTPADSIKRDSLMKDLQKLATKAEKDNPAVSAILLVTINSMLMDKEKVIAAHCAFLNDGMVINYLKEIKDAEKLLEIMQKATENSKKKPE